VKSRFYCIVPRYCYEFPLKSFPHAFTNVDPLYNARIAYSLDNGWTASLWGQNLSDEQYWRAASAGSFTTYAAAQLTWGICFSRFFASWKAGQTSWRGLLYMTS
jgi:hypothetical protein